MVGIIFSLFEFDALAFLYIAFFWVKSWQFVALQINNCSKIVICSAIYCQVLTQKKAMDASTYFKQTKTYVHLIFSLKSMANCTLGSNEMAY